MRNAGKQMLMVLAAILVVTAPAAASSSSSEMCQTTVGQNVVSYQCRYAADGYQAGSPLSLKLDYDCSGRCGGVLAFGLDAPGYEPSGQVEGRILSLDRRSQGSMAFTMRFDKLAESPSSRGQSKGTAFMTVLVNVDDGTGRFRATSLPFQVDVNSHPGGSSGSN